jgi:hypothetical protein
MEYVLLDELQGKMIIVYKNDKSGIAAEGFES